MERRSGFTLFELMIVVTVIAVIAGFALPSLFNSLKGGRETAAISSLRTLSSVSEQYRLRFGRYASSLAALTAAGYIDSVLGSGTKSGYTYTYSSGAPRTFTCAASAETAGVTGDRHFFIDQTGTIHVNLVSPATSSDPPLE